MWDIFSILSMVWTLFYELIIERLFEIQLHVQLSVWDHEQYNPL